VEPELAAMLTETVTHEAYQGQDGYGSPLYGAAALRPCRVEYRVSRIVTAQGEERTSNTRIFFDTDFELKLRDRIVLADGTAPQMLMIYRPPDEFGNIYYQECRF
jgi:hypothetical protein